MNKHQSNVNVLRTIFFHPSTTILTQVLGLTGLSLPISLYLDQEVNFVIVAIVFFVFLLLVWMVRRSIARDILPGEEESKYFFPFLDKTNVDPNTTDERIISRFDEALELANHIKMNPTRHVFLVGESGVGKSMLLERYFDFSQNGEVCEPIQEYQNPFEEIHNRLSNYVSNTAKEISRKNYKSMIESIDDAMKVKDAHSSECVEKITEYVGSLEFDKSVLLILEQAERALRLLKSKYSGDNLYSLYVRELISQIRRHPKIFTLFVLRGDYAVDAIESLIDYEASPVFGRTFDYVSIFVLSGIEIGEKTDNYRVLREKVRGGIGFDDFEKFSVALSLENKTQSNTFLIQLTGYLLEHFHRTDKRIKEALDDPLNLPNRMVEIYLSKLADEYYVEASDWAVKADDAKSALFATLFVLAVENRNVGRALTEEQIVGLSHFPADTVNNALSFLTAKGVVMAGNANAAGYRIAHDILAENIVRNESVELRDEYKTTYRVFSQSRSEESVFITGLTQNNILLDLFHRGRQITRPQIFILLCMGILLFRALWPLEALALYAPINNTIDEILPGAVNHYGNKIEFYLPVLVTQFLWVSFMYKLDRAYFERALEGKGGSTRFFSSTGAPLGALFGVLLAFSPSLFIIPIIAGGTFLAIAYWLHSRSSDVGGPAFIVFRELTKKIASNMVVSVGITIVVYVILKDAGGIASGYFRPLFTIWFFCFCYMYYWAAMQPRQGSQVGWSTLLLLCDRGRQVSKQNSTA